jgi:glycosyltransferase involved in cell wall biosynthesis
MMRAVQAADLLVLPVNFDRASRRFIQYSMPAKIAAYLASGTPLLVYGPADVPPVCYAREHGVAVIVDVQSPRVLAQAIAKVLGDEQLRARLTARAVTLARERHDIGSVLSRFEDCVRRAVAHLEESLLLPAP